MAILPDADARSGPISRRQLRAHTVTEAAFEGRGCVNSGLMDVGHHTRFEIIDRRHDLQLPGPGEISEERAPQCQALGRPPSALLGRIVYEVPRLALNGDGRWQ